MKISSNKTSDIREYIKKRLEGLYPAEEIQSFTFMLFEAYCAMSKAQVLANMRSTINESELLLVYDAVKELEKHRPIQYIIGKTIFYDLEFKVNEHVLIPRPETEELVAMIINQNQHRSGLRILDIGTGSGCIAIALKKHMPYALVDAIDISVDALLLADRNSKKLGAPVLLEQCDILDESQWLWLGDFNLIVSNPPYVMESEKQFMQPNVLNYEPSTALFVTDENPLLFYEAIMHFARYNGIACKLYFEINENFGNDLFSLGQKNNFSEICIMKDINGKDRFLSMQKA